MEFEGVVRLLMFPLDQAWRQIAENPGSRFYLPFILGGVAFAIVLQRLGLARFDKAALTTAYWLGPSARVDYFLTALNPLIRFLFFGGLITWLAGLGDGYVTAAVSSPYAIGLAALLTLALFIADDFVRFFAHWLMHQVPAMWSFHRVHHAATSMTFATADRHHFMEIIFVTLPLVATYSAVNTAFIVATGIETTPLAIAGANVVLVVFNSLAGAFRHGPAWVSFGPAVEKWLISPAMHQIHHSVNERHYNMNMGGTLAIWDRMFGTHYSPTGPEELSDGIGLGDEGRVLNTFGGTLAEPFGHAVRTLTESKGDGAPLTS